MHIKLKPISQVSERKAAKQIAEETTLNPKEPEMVIAQFEKMLIKNILSSNCLKLGDLGSFHLTCGSNSAYTKKLLSVRDVKGQHIRFVSGKEIKQVLAKANFVFVENHVK